MTHALRPFEAPTTDRMTLPAHGLARDGDLRCFPSPAETDINVRIKFGHHFCGL